MSTPVYRLPTTASPRARAERGPDAGQETPMMARDAFTIRPFASMRRRVTWRRVRGVARGMCALVLLQLAGCAGLPWTDSEAEPHPDEVIYAEGMAALDAGDFVAAENRFRRLAARCESGDRGRSALLALVTAELDLRNEEGDADEAARLAAIHLNAPDAPAAERSLSRTLYLLAVYRGAVPIEGPEGLDPRSRGSLAARSSGEATEPDSVPPVDSAGPADSAAVHPAEAPTDTAEVVDARGEDAGADTVGMGPLPATVLEPARRFDRCDSPVVAWRGVPEYPGTPPIDWARADTTIIIQDRGGAGEAEALRARIRGLEAELARVRKLLRGGGGGGVPYPLP